MPELFTDSTEPEAIKLSANTYFTMRVAYFNHLDTYDATNELDARQTIDGVCLDPRIGTHRSNPSFGHGGYCLPKDTMQLLANNKDMPQSLIHAIVETNTTRKDFVAGEFVRICEIRSPARTPKVGINRSVMKQGSDKFRTTAIQVDMKPIKVKDIDVILCEPSLKASKFYHSRVFSDLLKFKRQSDVILANRLTSELAAIKSKTYSRDLFGHD